MNENLIRNYTDIIKVIKLYQHDLLHDNVRVDTDSNRERVNGTCFNISFNKDEGVYYLDFGVHLLAIDGDNYYRNRFEECRSYTTTIKDLKDFFVPKNNGYEISEQDGIILDGLDTYMKSEGGLTDQYNRQLSISTVITDGSYKLSPFESEYEILPQNGVRCSLRYDVPVHERPGFDKSNFIEGPIAEVRGSIEKAPSVFVYNSIVALLKLLLEKTKVIESQNTENSVIAHTQGVLELIK